MQEVSRMAEGLIGSEIIKLGAEINQRIKAGQHIFNLTIGDFDPKIFPLCPHYRDLIVQAYLDGETNYPPADGVKALKDAVRNHVRENQQLEFGEDEVLITCGGRPGIYAIYETLLDPDDKVVYPVPSWNNNHYCQLTSAQKIEIHTRAEDAFMPMADELEGHLTDATILALCSPLNPTGTTFSKQRLKEICQLVLEENQRRDGKRKPLYILYDQIYSMLRVDGVEHVDPVSLEPQLKPYTIYVDGISKMLSATGVRVGWVLGPAHLISKMKAIIGHVGAWAPRAEQVSTAAFLSDKTELSAFMLGFKQKLQSRLVQLANGINTLNHEGYPLRAIQPEGAIYLSVQFALMGKKVASGSIIQSTKDISDFLLDQVGLAAVPFTAFGCEEGTDWYRLSVGTLQEDQIPELLQRLKVALDQCGESSNKLSD